MDRFRALHVFITVADHQGFAPAAAKLRMSPAAVTRVVAALEDQFGTRLLARTTRKVRLTDAGAHVAKCARRILSDLADVESAISGAAQAVRGRIRLTAPVLFGRYHVAPLVFEFMRRHPDVTVDLLLMDRITDLVEENVDVAVRIAELADASLTAVSVGRVGRVLCASPDYLARRGEPKTLADIEALDGIELVSASAQQWTFWHHERERTIRPRIVLSANVPEVVVAACLQGMGLARFMTYQVKTEIATGRLCAVLTPYEIPARPVHLVFSTTRHIPQRLRALLEHMKAGLRDRDI